MSKKILSIVSILLMLFAFASCKKKTEGHTHEWDEGTVTKEATCTSTYQKD